MNTGIEVRISCSDTMINYRFSQKLKLLGNDEFNNLTIILTIILTTFEFEVFNIVH